MPSVEVTKKLANTFAVTLDYLVDDTGRDAEIRDKAMPNRLMEIETLEQEDKETIVHVLDSLLRDAKAKKAYAPNRSKKHANRKHKRTSPSTLGQLAR